MKEIVFIVEESHDGGYFARAANHSIITQGETMEELRNMIADAVRCHFVEEEMPAYVHLHVTREETFSL
ncbi:MAG: 2-oxoisovalerate dehydrogenase [Bacteroidetes bacterium]|jgi:predicted RNase H-like HicB family nuclease|nr:2-oxoisovalerate dehydrogenase [Bacteroidota bacterium]